TVRLVNPAALTIAMDTLKLQLLPPTTPSPSGKASPATLTTGVFGVMLTTIHAASPPHWTFDLAPDQPDGDWTWDGTVDDGSGPGHLMVNVTATPGTLEAHPCSDAQFTQGAPCVGRPGPGGAILAIRGILDEKG